MEKLNRIASESQLRNLPITYNGSNYSPVTHGEVIDSITDYVKSQGFVIESRQYLSAANGQQIIGKYVIGHPNLEIKPMLAFKNSQDGKISFGICSGLQTMICSNGAVIGDAFAYKRRHSGNGHVEILENAKYAVESMYEKFASELEVVNALKEIQMSKRTMAELAGRLFVEEKLLQSDQLSIIGNEINKPTFDYGNPESAWEFYNHCTYAFKEAHPIKWHKQHAELTNFFVNEYNIEI